ncbi:MAG TPA: crosslink repair DNA glycosylase YcaQ family protein [Candidatus Limnocylindria bacterium]|nr:crosslink repair DNA glycosylase YcaQ family protein [Candidatus Limnocylindria bacterium]
MSAGSALSLRQLNRATLARQGLLTPLPAAEGAARLVHRIGSLQAQHPDWPPVALQARLGPSDQAVDLAAARHRREVVRASLMRVTVHVVAADDFWPMSTVTIGFRARQWRLLYKQDPAASSLGRKITAAHPAALAALRESPLGISEIERVLAAELPGVEIPPHRSLWRHFSGTVPLVQVPYEGETYGRQRYAPAIDWMGQPGEDDADPDRAAAHLAAVYLGAFGPASIDDLVAYVGRGDAIGRWRRALQSLGERIVHFTDPDGRALVDLADAPRPDEDVPAPPRLLARWDSLLLAYATRHRARVLPPEHQATVITRNADVLPTFLVDGVVAGTWLPREDAAGRRIELRPFGALADGDREMLEAQATSLLPTLRGGAFGRYPGTE